MTRTLTTVQSASLGLESGVALVAFLELNFGGGTIRLATAPVDLSWNGVTWQGIGGRLVIEPPREAPGDDRSQSLRLELSGVDQAILAVLLQQEYIGRTVRAWYAHVALGTNLIGNSGFESGTTGYSATGASLSRVTTPAPWEGGYCLACAMSVSAADQGLSSINNLGTDLPVTPGASYAFGFRARMGAGSGQRQWRAYIDFYTSGISYISSSAAVVYNPDSAAWHPVEVTAVAPATAAIARPRTLCQGATGLYTLNFDGFYFRPANDTAYQPTDGAPIQGGTILLDPIRLGSWFMNGGFEIEESAEFEQLTCSISCRVTSRLAALTNRRGIKTNLESHGRHFLGDKFFEHVPAIADKEIVWGQTWFRHRSGLWYHQPSGKFKRRPG